VPAGLVAWAMSQRGDVPGAGGGGEAGAGRGGAVPPPARLVAARTLAGLVYCRRGDVHTAIRVLEQDLALIQLTNILVFPITASLLSVAYALAGRTAEALPLLDQMLERVVTGNRMFVHA